MYLLHVKINLKLCIPHMLEDIEKGEIAFS